LVKNFVNKILANGSFYLGEYYNNLPNGHGILLTQAGYLYRGQFKDGALLGPMVGISPTGEVLVSEFLDGKPKNDTGLEITLEGFVRKIWPTNEAPTISVTDFYPDGHIFKGQMLNNKPNGFGFSFKSNGEIYKGAYNNGAAHGYGVMIRTDGSIYRGQFMDGKGSGLGALIKPNGDIYFGQFIDNHPEGSGFVVKFGKFIFKGTIINGKGEGRGVLITDSNKFFAGDFKLGRPNGHGLMFSVGPNFFNGDVPKDQAFGAVSEIFRGVFQNGVPIGENALSNSDLSNLDLSERSMSCKLDFEPRKVFIEVVVELDSSVSTYH
jgi:hypothetical protein